MEVRWLTSKLLQDFQDDQSEIGKDYILNHVNELRTIIITIECNKNFLVVSLLYLHPGN